MSGHPIRFIDYACGHSTPIRGGSSVTADRPCRECAAGYVPVKLDRPITVRTLMLGQYEESPYAF